MALGYGNRRSSSTELQGEVIVILPGMKKAWRGQAISIERMMDLYDDGYPRGGYRVPRVQGPERWEIQFTPIDEIEVIEERG